MNTMSVIEYTLAFAFGISLIGLLPWYKSKGSDKWPVLCLFLSVLWLVIDASAYHLMEHQEAPFALRYTVDLLAYIMGNIIFIFFVQYREAYVRERMQLNPWLFRAPIVLLAVNVLIIVGSFAAGKIVVFENGIEIADNGTPLYATAIWLAALLHLPCVAWKKRKVLGKRATVLLCMDMLPIFTSVIAVFTGRDLTVACGSLEMFLVVVFLQKIKADENISNREENRALTDRQILLDYFVDQYWSASFIDLKNDTLEIIRAENANTDAYIMDGTEADMAKFIKSHFHPDDVALMLQITNKDFVRRELKDKASVSYTAREIINGEERTMRIQIIRCSDEDHVAVGFIDITAEIEEEKNSVQDRLLKEQKVISENNARFFALEDTFESLYDVEMESGRYTSYVKGDFYQSNVLDKLVTPTDYFEDLRANIDAVIFPEDRAGLYDVLTRESIRSELAESEHFDYYYRLITENGPVWFKMRIVYKNAAKENVIIGVFNASGDVETKQLEEQKAQLQETLTFTDYFLDTYVSAYYVDLDTLACQIYKRTEELEKDYPIIQDYFSSLTEYIGRDVHPEDRDGLLEIVRPENMKKALRIRPEFSQIFRDISGGTVKYYRMQVIRGAEENRAAFGFIDITNEVNEQNARQLEAEESKKLIDSIAASYNVAFAVNMKTDAFRLIRMDDTIIGSDKTFTTFSEAKDFFIGILPENDREKMRHELDYGTIREKLKNTKSYNIEYRVPIRNALIWHIMNVTLIDNDYVALGFAERDVEITQRHLEDKRYGEYFALYEIDLDTGMMKIVKDSPYYGIDRAGTAIPFVPAMHKFAAGLDSEPRAFFERLTDLDIVRKDMAEEDKHTYAYRSNNVGNRNWVDCTSYVTLRHDDGTPAMFTLGFSMVDSLGVYRQELQSRYKEALDVVSEEKHRNDILHDIINSGKWSFRISADDRVIGADYSDAVMRVINNDFSSGADDWVQILHPDDKEAALEAFNAAIADHSGKTPYDVTYRMADRNGVYHWFHSAGRVVRNEDGTGEFFGIHIDITAQIEEQLKQQSLLEDARIAADAANQAKSSFLFNMSHDIRTPMNAIRGFTAMAKKNAGDEKKVLEYLDKIDISGDQLLKLINQVLEMARIESGRIAFEEKPVTVSEEFHSMVTVLSEQAKVNGLNFHYSLGTVEHNCLLADEARVSSITLNIAGNAMKYTPEGGSIEFDLKEIPPRKPGFATFVFTVADTGIGMSKEYLKELYEPFSREKSSTVSKIQGTGLGLSIVKNLIDLLGGNIEVESELGKGTRFDITLDFRIDENAAQPKTETDDMETVSFEGRRVLLVDDNEMNREIAKDILEEHGLTVEDAEDGDIAVAMVQAVVDRGEFHYYDFILMDVQMPRMNGYDATRAIRAIPGPEGVHIPIIAMTANAFEEDRQNALAAGMDEHLAKPIDVNKAFRTIAKYLS